MLRPKPLAMFQILLVCMLRVHLRIICAVFIILASWG